MKIAITKLVYYIFATIRRLAATKKRLNIQTIIIILRGRGLGFRLRFSFGYFLAHCCEGGEQKKWGTHIGILHRRVAFRFAAAFFPSTRFSKAWSSAPWRRCSSRIYRTLRIVLKSDRGPYRFKFVELRVWLVRRFIGARLCEYLTEFFVHTLLVQFITVELQPFDELFD